MKVKVAISNRHVHLTKEVYKELFNKEELPVKRYLNQIGEYASDEVLTLKYNGKILENVRIVGPLRNYNQVELLKSDFDYLGIEEIVRKSGDVKGTPGITLINDNKKITLEEGVIRQERHIHVNTNDNFGFLDRDEVIVNGKFNAFIKISDNGYFELHIDKDEAKEFNLENGDEVNFIKK